MVRIKPLNKDEAVGEVRELFEEIEKNFGMIPNLFKTYAYSPPLLKANWNKVKEVMMKGSLSNKVKQTIALLVSKDNSCNYCVAAHTAALKSIGVTYIEMKMIEKDIKNSDFSEKEQALISFVLKANLEPLKISDTEFFSLRQAGASDNEIIEALGVMELFTAFNKFLDSLQVEIDF